MEIAAFSQWLSALRKGLEAGDAEALSALFSQDALFYDTPFQAPKRGRVEIQLLFEAEARQRVGVSFDHEMIDFGEDVGWAAWSTGFNRAGLDDPVRIEGILKAVFKPDGTCVEFRQWWHIMEPGQGELMRDFDA